MVLSLPLCIIHSSNLKFRCSKLLLFCLLLVIFSYFYQFLSIFGNFACYWLIFLGISCNCCGFKLFVLYFFLNNFRWYSSGWMADLKNQSRNQFYNSNDDLYYGNGQPNTVLHLYILMYWSKNMQQQHILKTIVCKYFSYDIDCGGGLHRIMYEKSLAESGR